MSEPFRQVVECARALVGGEEVRDFAFLVEGEYYDLNAKILSTGSIANLRAAQPAVNRKVIDGNAVVAPGFVNAHSHAYQILLRGWADDLPFDRWRAEALYKIIPQLTPDEVYVVFYAAFLEMAQRGITTVVEFFYLNGCGIEHALAAIRAARAADMRLILARTWMDAEYAPELFRESIDQAQRDTQRLIDLHPEVLICPAPHSLHAASADMIREAVSFARSRHLPTHIHVAEAEYEGAELKAKTGMRPVQYLSEIGALYEGLVAVHAIYVSDEEKKMLAEAGAGIVHNPMTNQYLGDGICDIVRYCELGVPIALGTDANVHPSILEEMRAAALLAKVMHRRSDALDAKSAWNMGTAGGGAVLHHPVGDLKAGMYADYIVVEPDRNVHPWTPIINGIVYAGDSSWIRERRAGFSEEPDEGALGPGMVDESLRKIRERLSF